MSTRFYPGQTDYIYQLNLLDDQFQNWLGGVSTFTDDVFTVTDGTDTTRKIKFELSNVSAGTTRTLTAPNASGTIALTNVTQTVSGSNTFSNASNTFGSSTATGTTTLASGATLSGSTKTVHIGTNGVSGSTTNITIGSSVSGAINTITFNAGLMFGPTVTFNVNGSGPGEQANGLYVADLGGTQGTTLNPTFVAAICGQLNSGRSVAFSIADGYLYGFRSHSNAGTYVWTSKVRQADTLLTARNINGVAFNGSADITVADSTKLPLTGGTITGDLHVGTTSASPRIDFGRTDGTASNPMMDFHSGATAIDYDSRITASGGNGTNGAGSILTDCMTTYLSGATNASASLVVSKVTNAINRISITGAVAGGTPSIQSVTSGSDTAVGLNFSSYGAAGINFYTHNYGSVQFVIGATANANRHVLVTGGLSGTSGVGIGVGGGGEALDVHAAGGYPVFIATNGKRSATQLEVAHTATAVNYLSVTGAAANGTPAISVKGTDTDIGLDISSKGSDAINLRTGGGRQFAVVHEPSATNYIYVKGASTGNAPVLAVGADSDTDVNLTLTPRGNGTVKSTRPFDSDIGVKIGTTTSTDANTLDYYQEGQFTPAVAGSTTAGIGTYSARGGWYTRIGNRVMYHLYIDVSAHDGTGNIEITGLPFTVDANTSAPAQIMANNLTFTGQLVARAFAGTTKIRVDSFTSGGGVFGVAMDSVFSVWISGTYMVA